MQNEKIAHKFAAEGLPHTAEFIHALADAKAEILYAEDDGLLIYRPSGERLLFSAKSRKACEKMVEIAENHKEYDTLLAHNEEYWDYISQKLSLEYDSYCTVFAYMSGSAKPPQLPDGVEIRRLDRSHLPLVVKYYHLFTDEEYFAFLLDKGYFLGIYENGEPAGFIGRHGSGSMGLLEIFPAFRRKGYGFMLEKQLICELLQQGVLPFGHVMAGNDASFALQKKLGFSCDESQKLAWMNKPEQS